MIIKQFSMAALGLTLLATTAIAEEKAEESITPSHETVASPATAEHCEVKRFLTAKGIADREPHDATETFSASDEKVVAFAELSCSHDGHVTFHWKHEGKDRAKVQLPVKSSSRWRTYSYETHPKPGNWSVAILDDAGTTLKEMNFTVTGSESSHAPMHHAESEQPEHHEQTAEPEPQQ